MIEPSMNTPDVEQTPLSRLARVIIEDGPVDAAVVYDLANQLKVKFTDEAQLRSMLNREFGVVYSRRSDAFVGGQAAATGESLRELVHQWVMAPDGRDQLETAIRERATTVEVSGSGHALASVLGLAASSPDWTRVEVDESAPREVVTAVVRRAPTWWLVDVATGSPSAWAEVSKARFQSMPIVEQNEEAAKSLARWAPSVDHWGSNAKRLRKLGSVVSGDLSLLTVDGAVNAANAIVSEFRPSDDSADMLVALVTLLEKPGPDIVAGSIDRCVGRSEIVRGWLVQLGNSGKKARERSFLASVVARTHHTTALFDDQVFAGLDVTTLGKLLAQREFDPLVHNGLLNHCRKAVHKSLPSKFGPAVAVFADHPVLEPLAPIERLSNLLAIDEASARVTRGSTRLQVEAAVGVARSQFDEQVAVLQTELAASQADRDGAQLKRQEAEARAAASAERHRLAVSSSSTASSAEVRQAQVDGLRVCVDQIERLRSLASTMRDQSGLMNQEIETSSRALRALGVRIVGIPGDQVRYDPAEHEGAADLVAGELAVLLTPVYRLEAVVTPLRYGLVRPLSR